MNACDIDLDELPDQGTNQEGTPWEEVRDAVSSMCDRVNMTPDELDSWTEHSCADTHSIKPQQVRARMHKALETHPRNWVSRGSVSTDDPEDMGHVEIANKSVSFNSRAYGSWQATESTYKEIDGERCPNGWGVALLNWARDPDKTYEEYY